MKKIDLKGYLFTDGVHWYYKDEEIAIVNESLREIEWIKSLYQVPKDVIEKIRNSLDNNTGKWVIEARRVRISATQQYIQIYVNNEFTGMSFEDKLVLKNGEYVSTTPDNELGKFVCASLWHKYDDVYHYSDRFKNIFYSKNEKTLEGILINLGADKVFDDDGLLTEEGVVAQEKLLDIINTLNLIGLIAETSDECEKKIDEIINIGF